MTFPQVSIKAGSDCSNDKVTYHILIMPRTLMTLYWYQFDFRSCFKVMSLFTVTRVKVVIKTAAYYLGHEALYQVEGDEG